MLIKRRMSIKLLLTMIVVVLCNILAAQVEIRDVEGLNQVREGLDREYRLVANIDLGDIRNWQPIGTEQQPFTGSFDGNGYKILNMTIARWEESGIGLFGVVSGGTIKNLGLESRNITGCTYVGGLVGYLTNRGVVASCYSIANITGNRAVGGLVGYCEGENSIVTDSYSGGAVSSEADAGGLIGMLSLSTITNCYAFAEVEGFLSPGGLVAGRIQDGRVQDSFWDVEASGIEESFGGRGLATRAMISRESYPEAWNFEEMWNITDGVTYPYLRWQREPSPHNYPGSGGPSSLVALAGDRDVNLTWNEPSNGLQVAFNLYRNDQLLTTLDDDVTRYRDQQVQNYVQYTYYVTAVWEDENESRPSNSVTATPHEAFAGGDGTEDDPYQVASAQNLNDIRYKPDSFFIQTANINLGMEPWNQGMGWNPVGYYVNHIDNNIFSGVYDGDGYTITGLRIHRIENNFVGLFGYLSGATIRNVVLTNIDVTGVNYVGGLIGYSTADTVIENCYVSGEVDSRASYVGSIIGYMHGGEISGSSSSGSVEATGGRAGGIAGSIMNGDVYDCNSSADITVGNQFAGGLIGYIRDGTVDFCYALGDVTGRTEIGGLIGQSRDEVTNSFASGDITGTNLWIGGLIGRNYGEINGCYADNHVIGYRSVGGLVGESNAPIINSYAVGTVTGSDNVNSTDIGGLVGKMAANIINSFATPRITGAGNMGGLVGSRSAGTATNSYWDIQRTGQHQSAQGEGRTTDAMTFPYADNTYQNWNFINIWQEDEQRQFNQGYPYLRGVPTLISPNPTVAENPQPQHQAENVSANIEQLIWVYVEDVMFTNPVGFRVYMNTTGHFGHNHEYFWVDYVDEQENYACSEILADGISWNTVYYWKVVPTTIHPDEDGRRGDYNSPNRLSRQTATPSNRQIPLTRGDAENIPVWRFTTAVSPNPDTASNPSPAYGAENVSPDIEELAWSYSSSESFTDPVGFRVYFNTTGEFTNNDDFEWVNYIQGEDRYSVSDILPERLNLETKYYWKVVPTTIHPDDDGHRGDNRQRRLQLLAPLRSRMSVRGDAENVSVWSFTVRARFLYPAHATNCKYVDEHNRIVWQYISDSDYTDPVGFRVYMNMTGAFGSNAPFEWIEFTEGEQDYYWGIPYQLEPLTTYYYRIVPTTKEDGVGEGYDAVDSPVKRFTTGETSVNSEYEVPLISEIRGNYPNPFNPETTISFSISAATDVSIVIYNSRGQKIVNLIQEHKEAGFYNVRWSGTDSHNRTVPSGVYFARMHTGNDNRIDTVKMLLLK